MGCMFVVKRVNEDRSLTMCGSDLNSFVVEDMAKKLSAENPGYIYTVLGKSFCCGFEIRSGLNL